MGRPPLPKRADGKLRCKFCKKLSSKLVVTKQGPAYHRECNAAYQRERRRRLKDG